LKTLETPPEMARLKEKLRETWMAGDYDLFSRYMEQESRLFYENLAVPASCRFLDVACGSGQLALMAARDGMRVVGVDIAPNQIDRARIRARAEELSVRFLVGDAEALPFDNDRFDVVVSMFGAMFAPRPQMVGRELLRVCSPGGTIAMANWTPEGFIGKMFRTFSKFVARPGMPSPVLWGDQSTVRERLGPSVSDLKMTPRFHTFTYPFSPAQVVEFFRQYYGPSNRAFLHLDEKAANKLRAELEELWTVHNRGNDDITIVRAEYLEVIANRT
jgi:ubiquinone/menaquinone biosynthesis C-methylase UbiE